MKETRDTEIDMEECLEYDYLQRELVGVFHPYYQDLVRHFNHKTNIYQEFYQSMGESGAKTEHIISKFIEKFGLTGHLLDIRNMKITEGLTNILHASNPKAIYMRKVYQDKKELLLSSKLTVTIFFKYNIFF